jgi:hypothetical protein
LIIQHWRITCRTKIGKENHYFWLIFEVCICHVALLFHSLDDRWLVSYISPRDFFLFFSFLGSEFVSLPSTPFLTKYIGRPLAERINKTKITHSSFRFPWNSDSAQIWFPFEKNNKIFWFGSTLTYKNLNGKFCHLSSYRSTVHINFVFPIHTA